MGASLCPATDLGRRGRGSVRNGAGDVLDQHFFLSRLVIICVAQLLAVSQSDAVQLVYSAEQSKPES